MNITVPGIYHIYNRGNNQQPVFFSDANYIYFLHKCQKYIKPVSDIFAWCLMKNHFHFLINVTEQSLLPIKSGGISMPAIVNAFRLLQSSYAKGINKQESRSGNLFQQKTKAKLVTGEIDYSVTAFFYIHQNPVVANIIASAEEWKYSSFQDYTGKRNGNLCNKEKAISMLNLSAFDLKIENEKEIEADRIKSIFD